MKLVKMLAAVAFAVALTTTAALAEAKIKDGSCCDKAKKAGKECAHPCCKKASEAKGVCEKCNK